MDCDCAGVTQLGAFEAIVADYDVGYVAMLEYHAEFAGRDAFPAISASIYKHYIGAIVATVDSFFGADFHTFAALRADSGFVLARLREMGLDFQAGLFGIYLVIMADRANLHTQAASAALAR